MNKTYKIAGLGEVLWDVHGDDFTFGGAPGNCACHCNSLGAKAYTISCIGDDQLGVKAKAFLDQHGINTTGLAISSEFETGIVNIELDFAGKPEYHIIENVAWDNIPFTEEMAAIAPELDAVCFGSLAQRNSTSRKTIETFLKATSEGCVKLFDINIRLNYYTEEIIKSSLMLANALKINDEELPLLANILALTGTNEEQMLAILDICDLKLVILTCGSEGALMMTRDDKSFAKPEKIDSIASTVGAGDSYTATALMGYLQGKKLETINKHANAVAGYVCTQTGAVPQLPEKLIKGEL